MLPFSEDAFFALFESYNRAIWPAQPLASLLGLVALLPLFGPVRGGDRALAALLALAWAWNGIAYHLLHFATLSFMAPLFGALFLLQALLFAWSGAIRGRLEFRFRPDLCGWSGLALAVFALAVYPLLGWLAGHGWPRAALFGVAPSPTTLFTFGLLLTLQGRVPLHLLAIPLLWSLIGGASAFLLGVPEDIVLPVAGLGSLLLALLKAGRARPVVTPSR
ncbi:MAG: DUF6064 family protein [Kiloniellales bacterium]